MESTIDSGGEFATASQFVGTGHGQSNAIVSRVAEVPPNDRPVRDLPTSSHGTAGPHARFQHEATHVDLQRSYRKTTVLVLFFSVGVMVMHFTPLKLWFQDMGALRASLAGAGLWAPVAYLALTALSIFVGAPRLPFCVLGGLLFGFIEGLALSQFGSLLGAYGPYLFARFSSSGWIEMQLRRFEGAGQYLDDPTIFNVFLFRQIPVWGVFTNLCLGSVGVSHRTFILGSFLGFLPQAIIFTLIGSGLVEESLLRALSRVWVAIAIIGAATVVMSRFGYRARGEEVVD